MQENDQWTIMFIDEMRMNELMNKQCLIYFEIDQSLIRNDELFETMKNDKKREFLSYIDNFEAMK